MLTPIKNSALFVTQANIHMKLKCCDIKFFIYRYISVISTDLIHFVYTDPPTIKTLSQQDIIEGGDLSVTCKANPGNPSSTTIYWTKVYNPGFRRNVSTLQSNSIQKNSSGTYRCIAENNYSNGEKGTHSQSMVVNVLCKIFFILIYPHFILYVVITFLNAEAAVIHCVLQIKGHYSM